MNRRHACPDASCAHAAVNGVSLYYEIHGNGRPLVLLHGGVSAFLDGK